VLRPDPSALKAVVANPCLVEAVEREIVHLSDGQHDDGLLETREWAPLDDAGEGSENNAVGFRRRTCGRSVPP
jgi:hypothetical protein